MTSKLTLPSGRTIQLPPIVDRAEFGHAGNSEEHAEGNLIALFDPTSETGMIWLSFPQPIWIAYHPCERESFFGEYVPRKKQEMFEEFDALRAGLIADLEPQAVNALLERLPFLSKKE